MSADPRVRQDELCAHCGGPRLIRLPKVITIRSKTDLLAELHRDPFCSAQCCRAHHLVDVAEQPQKVNAIEERQWGHETG